MGASLVALALSLAFGLSNIQGGAISESPSATTLGKRTEPGLSEPPILRPRAQEQPKYDVELISKRLDGEGENRSMPYAEEDLEETLFQWKCNYLSLYDLALEEVPAEVSDEYVSPVHKSELVPFLFPHPIDPKEARFRRFLSNKYLDFYNDGTYRIGHCLSLDHDFDLLRKMLPWIDVESVPTKSPEPIDTIWPFNLLGQSSRGLLSNLDRDPNRRMTDLSGPSGYEPPLDPAKKSQPRD